MKTKTIISFFLCFSLLSTSVFASSIDDLKEQREREEREQQNLESELDEIRHEKETLEEKMEKLTNEIKTTMAQIKVVEGKIEDTEQKIEETKKEIEITEADLEEKKEILARNLRILQMKGEVTYMEFLFRSEDVSDFLYRFNSLKSISEANRILYDIVRDTMAKLKLQKETLEATKLEQEKQKNELVALKNTQDIKRNEQLVILKELEHKEDHLENEIASQEAALAEIETQIQEAIRREQERRNNGGEVVNGSGQFIIPIPAGSYYISSGYGYRTHPVYGTQKLHNGIDYAAPYGTPILAADSGTVLFARRASGYGHWVVINHNNGFYTIYGHMYGNQIYVQEGQNVTRGQQIAAVGSDGTSTGYHLHFTLSQGNWSNAINPNPYLP